MKDDTLLFVPGQTIAKPGISCIKTQSLNIFGFNPGEYHLTVQVTDGSSDKTVSAQSTFWVHEPQGTLSMTEEDIQRYRDQIKYIATAKELEVFDMVRDEGLEQFLVNFWRWKDTSPETPENEFMLNTFAKIAYTNEHFKGKGSGLNSDMGRVFVVYGQPDEVEDYSMVMESKPYTIWHYYTGSRGKHDFVFVDADGDGVYMLVHSTVVGEIKNTNWSEQEI